MWCACGICCSVTNDGLKYMHIGRWPGEKPIGLQWSVLYKNWKVTFEAVGTGEQWNDPQLQQMCYAVGAHFVVRREAGDEAMAQAALLCSAAVHETLRQFLISMLSAMEYWLKGGKQRALKARRGGAGRLVGGAQIWARKIEAFRVVPKCIFECDGSV